MRFVIYNMYWSGFEFGLGEKFVELFNEVQRSNMSKACDTEEQAQETVEHYKAKGEEAFTKNLVTN
jgi:hypothetical protein